ncbi:hypothetical protein [Rufibacter sp. XAAS-G3-1]|uniref:hypothetical protein n=1 Tax=Rufibacter sp. XAAS-G3-1 TaxID=2729134 RepID=UPI0015E69467|nr:hypothetical protein [Rufibacter sp. XAAS-G3-1]
MKKTFTKIAALLLLAGSFSGCATVFGGPVTEYQRTKPAPGQPQRQIRTGALVADILLFWPGGIIDFATGAIYKPQPKQPSVFVQPANGSTTK